MSDELKKTIEREIAKLPGEAQEAIAGVNWIEKTEAIGKKYILNGEEIDDLLLETLLVIIGAVEMDIFHLNIENELPTTREAATGMAKEIYETILLAINEKFEEISKKKLNQTEKSPEQNLNFILSGGDYGTFMEKSDDIIKDNHE